MKSFLVTAIFAGVALAQVGNLNGLPDCAKSCVNLNNLGGCKQLDIKCICSSKEFIDSISCCVARSCPNKSDQDNTIKFAQGICAPAGVTNLPTAPSCADGASSTGSSGGSSAAPSGSSSGSTTPTASDGSGSPEATGSSAASGSTPSPSPGAAGHVAAHGAAAMGGMILAALL